MGAFYVNFHIKTEDRDRVTAETAALELAEVEVLEPKRGWTTVLEARASDQDEEWIDDLVQRFSQRLQATAIAFVLHDSDFVCYTLCDAGKVVDRFNSMPDYFESVSKKRRQELAGKPTALMPYVKMGVTRDRVAELLKEEPTFGDDLLVQIADLFGIAQARVLTDYRHRDEDEFGDDDEGDDGGPDDFDGDDEHAEVASLARTRSAKQDGALLNAMKTNLEKLGYGARLKLEDPQAAALVLAAAAGDVAEIRKLVAAGADSNGMAQAPASALKPLARMQGSMIVGLPSVILAPLSAAALNNEVAAVRALVELGADLQAVDPMYGTAVHAAVNGGCPEVLEALLDLGADGKKKNVYNQTPAQMNSMLLASAAQAEQVAALHGQLGGKLPKGMKLPPMPKLPAAEWRSCQEILNARGL